MLRFLIRRGLSAIGLLFVVSVVSFVLIKAPPGDYADYAAEPGAQPGRPELRAIDHPARSDPREPRSQQAASASSISRWISGNGAPRRFRKILRLQQAGRRSALRALLAHARHRRHLPPAGDADRRWPRHRRRRLSAPLGRPHRLDHRLPRNDDPTLLHGAGHPLLARLHHRTTSTSARSPRANTSSRRCPSRSSGTR